MDFDAVFHTPPASNPKTNADRIRSMNDEELAVFLADKVPHGDCCDCWLVSCTDCKSDWFEWLQQPAEPPKE